MNMINHVYQCLWFVLFQNEMCVDKDKDKNLRLQKKELHTEIHVEN